MCCGGYGTLDIVVEQPEPYVVGFYCDACARRSGRRRLLAVANRNPVRFDGWDVAVVRRAGQPRPGEHPLGNDGGVPHGDFPMPILSAPGKRSVAVSISPMDPAAQLQCRRKVPEGERPHRPRVARSKLVELAEQTEAAGRHDAYV